MKKFRLKPQSLLVLGLVLVLGCASASPSFGNSTAACIEGAVSGRISIPFSSTTERPLNSIKELRIMTYNVLNLYENLGRFKNGERVKPNRQKSQTEIDGIGRVIRQANPDIGILEEIESLRAAQDFVDSQLEGAYQVLLIPGNDDRGINIAMIIKKDLPLDIEYISHADQVWNRADGDPVKVFSRDLPALVLREKGAPKDSMPLSVIFGTHFKSMRDSRGDLKSVAKRTAQAQAAAEIIGKYRAKYGEDLPIILAGDFNNNVRQSPEFAPLFDPNKGALTDAFDLGENPKSAEEVVTHTYHPKDGGREMKQMDAILVSGSLKGMIKDTDTQRYYYETGPRAGEIMEYATSHDQRKRQPSDHFAVVTKINFPLLLNRYRSNSAR